jgi:hypothetical protein
MISGGDYERLQPAPEAQGPEAEGTHATLMHIMATNGNAIVREMSVNHGGNLVRSPARHRRERLLSFSQLS